MRADNRPWITYVVETSKYGEFPLDMLRRDDASAATPEDEAMIALLNKFGDAGKDELPKRVRVTLKTQSRFAPNVERWESFGCKVVASENPYTVLSETRLPVDDARQRAVKSIAQSVVRLRGRLRGAEAVYDAIRYAGDVAGQDAPYREQAIGFCDGVLRVLMNEQLFPSATDDRIKVLLSALRLTRDLLISEGDTGRDDCIASAPVVVKQLDELCKVPA